MPDIRFGTSPVKSIRQGTTPVKKVAVGNTTIWPSGPTIAEENAKAGYASVNWDVIDHGNPNMLGFATVMSVRTGGTIDFKCHSGGSSYTLEIIRLGWYGSSGARLITTLSNPSGATQPEGSVSSTGEGGVGSRDCSNWTVTDTWNVPGDAAHGTYLGVIKPSASSTTWSHIGPFVVTNQRNDDAEILVMLSDTTWHAYNPLGAKATPLVGKSLYHGTGGAPAGVLQPQRAWDVTYDRPLMTATGALAHDFYWNGERPLNSWLERNGYDVGYIPSIDVHYNPSLLLGHEVLAIAGQHEYWSQEMRDGYDAAIAAGACTLSSSGNTMLWRVRFSGRTMTCYKDSHTLDGNNGIGRDPVTWTGTWRDQRWASRNPESSTIGSLFVSNGIRTDTPTVPVAYKNEPIWRNTAIAALASGQVVLKSGSLGFEWDSYEPFYSNTKQYPAPLKLLSDTPIDLSSNAANENGSAYNTTINPAHHHITAFRKPGNKLHVNFGSVQWAWGLSDHHRRGSSGVDINMQRATMNALADMNVFPTTKQGDISEAITNQFVSWVWPTVSSVTTPTTAAAVVGRTTRLSVLSGWSNGLSIDAAKDCVWSTDAPSIATVNIEGVVTGVAVGTANITATLGAFSDTTVVTVAPAPAWLNKTVLQATRNGTATRTVDFTAATAGNLLVAAVAGATVTTTSSTGWVKHTTALDQTELTLFTKLAAAGEASIVLNHAGSDRPVNVIVFEFPPGFTFQMARPSNSGGIASASNPTISPTSGTPSCFALNSSVIASGSTSGVYQIDWANPVVDENNMTQYGNGANEGDALSLGFESGVVGSSWTAAISTVFGYAAGSQRMSFSVRNSAGLSYVWQNGEEPAAGTDSGGFELGTYLVINKAITIEKVRVWAGSTVTLGGREAKLWSSNSSFSGGSVVATCDIPDSLPMGVSEYSFTTPYAAAAGTYLCISHPASQNWARLTGATTVARTTADGAITIPVDGGKFNGTPGLFPASSFGNTFYAVDVGYRL